MFKREPHPSCCSDGLAQTVFLYGCVRTFASAPHIFGYGSEARPEHTRKACFRMTKRPTPDEFLVGEDGVYHLPTGARFYRTLSLGEPMTIEFAILGSALATRCDYRQAEVEEMAEQLWAARSILPQLYR